MSKGDDTRKSLIIWGKAKFDGEYMSAGILRIEDYKDVDLCHPQGGPDGTKDIIAQKNGHSYVVGCWFPNDSHTKSYADLKKKFSTDLSGVKLNGANAFAFFTNKSITISERDKLRAIAKNAGIVQCDIFHLERIKDILCSPAGYGFREEYLGIPISRTELVSTMATQQKNSDEAKKIALETQAEFRDYVSNAMATASKMKDDNKISSDTTGGDKDA